MDKTFLSNDVREYLFNNISTINAETVIDPSLFSCYDDYYCNSDSLAKTGHIVLGVFGLLLSLLGLALNVLLIPVLSLVGIRSSATYYMIGMAISDCCLLIVNVILVVIRYLPSSTQVDQLLIYQNCVAYLVPFGSPMKAFFQALTTSLCTSLILDRFVYTKTESQSNTAKRGMAVKVMISVLASTIIYKLPNFLVFKIVENGTNVISIRWTLLAKSWIFVLDVTMFIMVFVVLIIGTSVLWYTVATCHFLPKLWRVKLVHFAVPPTERFHRREKLYVTIGLIVAILTAILKFPYLLRVIIFGVSTAHRAPTRGEGVADMWMEISDLVLVISKPCVYLMFAVHFRQALKDMIGLWVRPSRYTVMRASGGMGKEVDLTKKVGGINHSDTSNTLLQYCNSDNRINEIKCLGRFDMDALVEKVVHDSVKNCNNTGSNSSEMSAGSSSSVNHGNQSGFRF